MDRLTQDAAKSAAPPRFRLLAWPDGVAPGWTRDGSTPSTGLKMDSNQTRDRHQSGIEKE